MNNKFVNFGIIAIAIFALILSAPISVSANWLLDRTGTLIKIDPRILGDDDSQGIEVKDEKDDTNDDRSDDQNDDSNGSNEKETPKPASATQNEQLKKEQERLKEQIKKNAEVARKASDQAKTELEKKIQLNKIKNIKTKMESESEIEVEGNKLKIKQKIKDASGREIEKQMELKADEELELESQDGDEKKKFKIKASNDNSSIEIERDGFKAKSNLPISINENNELVVTRPDGTTKIVVILPDEALSRLKALNITPVVPGSKDDTLEDNMPVLEDEDGESVYKLDGQKEERILGLFKVNYKTKATVSAETGEVLKTEFSGLDKIWSLFSF